MITVQRQDGYNARTATSEERFCIYEHLHCFSSKRVRSAQKPHRWSSTKLQRLQHFPLTKYRLRKHGKSPESAYSNSIIDLMFSRNSFIMTLSILSAFQVGEVFSVDYLAPDG